MRAASVASAAGRRRVQVRVNGPAGNDGPTVRALVLAESASDKGTVDPMFVSDEGQSFLRSFIFKYSTSMPHLATETD